MDMTYLEFCIATSTEYAWGRLLLAFVAIVETLEAVYAAACAMTPSQTVIGAAAIAAMFFVGGNMGQRTGGRGI